MELLPHAQSPQLPVGQAPVGLLLLEVEKPYVGLAIIV